MKEYERRLRMIIENQINLSTRFWKISQAPGGCRTDNECYENFSLEKCPHRLVIIYREGDRSDKNNSLC